MNNAKIFLVDAAERRLIPIAATDYIDEDQLQRYLEDYPDLLAGDQIDPDSPRRWLFVARELGVPGEEAGSGRWSIDHLFIDQYGMPTFVECKRAVDTRTRREVVAQMLDYAANGAAYWPIDRIRQTASETAARRGAELDELIADLIDDTAEGAVDVFWERVEENLRGGFVRLLFVVDQAPRELRRLVEFLNEKMADVQVLIVEIKQYTGAGQTALVPRVLGQSQKIVDRKMGPSVRGPLLTRDEFLKRCSSKGAAICQQLWRMAEELRYEIVSRSTALAIRIERLENEGHSTLLLIYVGDEPGDEHIDFHLDHTMRKSDTAVAWREKLVESGLFYKRGELTARRHCAVADS